MPGIDYSKWDRMQFSDDDDDDSDQQEDRGGPRVTRLDQPSQVTVTPDGQVAIASSSSAKQKATTVVSTTTAVQHRDTAEQKGQNENSSDVEASKPSSASATATPPSLTSSFPASWTDKGGTTQYNATDILWTQDRESVTLRILIPTEQSTKAWQVQLRGRLAYADRHVGVGSAAQAVTLEIRHAQHGVLLPPTALPHAIHKAQGDDDDDDDAVVDWTIERADNSRAYITVPLYKAVPMAGVVLWWNRPLVGADEIDLSWRRTTDANAANFQQVWDQAHAQFRAKLAAEKNG